MNIKSFLKRFGNYLADKLGLVTKESLCKPKDLTKSEIIRIATSKIKLVLPREKENTKDLEQEKIRLDAEEKVRNLLAPFQPSKEHQEAVEKLNDFARKAFCPDGIPIKYGSTENRIGSEKVFK